MSRDCVYVCARWEKNREIERKQHETFQGTHTFIADSNLEIHDFFLFLRPNRSQKERNVSSWVTKLLTQSLRYFTCPECARPRWKMKSRNFSPYRANQPLYSTQRQAILRRIIIRPTLWTCFRTFFWSGSAEPIALEPTECNNKRGLAFDFQDADDLEALAGGMSWWWGSLLIFFFFAIFFIMLYTCVREGRKKSIFEIVY